ncbi:MAG: DUF2510 domain-containing protein [Mycobacteriaceae bacterium]|nr:DUF2510 domain-containing protein [Mycobacteriaceae bacterium]
MGVALGVIGVLIVVSVLSAIAGVFLLVRGDDQPSSAKRKTTSPPRVKPKQAAASPKKSSPPVQQAAPKSSSRPSATKRNTTPPPLKPKLSEPPPKRAASPDTGSQSASTAGLKVGGWAKVVAHHDDHTGRAGKVVQVCDESDEYDYCLQFQGDPELYAFRRDELVRANTPRLRRRAPVKVQDPHVRKPPVGWYPDPDARGGQRYWDGERWTDHRQSPTAGESWRRPIVVSGGVGVAILVVLVLILFNIANQESDVYKACVAEQKASAGSHLTSEMENAIEDQCETRYGR